MVFHIPWHNGVNLHAIVQEQPCSSTPLTLTLTTFLILYYQVKGSEFKKGVHAWHFTPWASHPGAPLACSCLSLRGSASLPHYCPLFTGLKAHLPSFLLAVENCRWSGLGCHSDNNASLSVECLSLLWPGAQWTLLSCLWCHPGLSPLTTFLLMSVVFSSRCTIHAEGVMAG